MFARVHEYVTTLVHQVAGACGLHVCARLCMNECGNMLTYEHISV